MRLSSLRVGRLVSAFTIASFLVLAGCSGSGDPEPTPTTSSPADAEPQDLLDRASEQFKKAGTVTVTGSLTFEGKTSGIEMTWGDDWIAGETSEEGVAMSLIDMEGTVLIQAGAPYWESEGFTADQAEQFARRWFRIEGDDRDTLMAEMERAAFVTELLKADGTLSTAETRTIDGVACLGITDTSDQDTATIYLDPTDGHLVLIVDNDTGEEITFDYQPATRPDLPSADLISDLTDLQNAA